jgi:phosphatidylethanolamine/phosphatidyl-N-methylethanolamine N-methyltransferase
MSINEYYEDSYNYVIQSGAIGKVAGIYHKMLERGHKKKFDTVLEIGAGTCQHFKFVEHDFDKYISTDIREPGDRIEKIQDSRHIFRLLNAEDLSSLSDESIDRLVVTCVLPHLQDPEKALKEWRRVVKIDGIIDIYVPCEPSILLGIAQKFTTKIKVEKLGYNYEKIQYREHRNHFPMMRMLINDVFETDIIKRRNFPPGISNWYFSLFVTFRIKKTSEAIHP